MRYRLIATLYTLCLIIALFATTAPAQSVTSSVGQSTPNALAKGVSPLGSYGGSNFDNINLFNGNLSMSMPLANLVGRTGMSGRVVISYNSKFWHSEKVDENPILKSHSVYVRPMYDPVDTTQYYLAPGWTIGIGKMFGRQIGFDQSSTCFVSTQPNNEVAFPGKTITTLTFTAPNGTEYDFRDDLYDGGPLELVNCAGQSRGTMFHSTNGSAATFVSDSEVIDVPAQVQGTYSPTGYVYLKEGTRFRIVKGLVTQERDHNGNLISYQYSGTKLTNITDTMGREINIAYPTTGNVIASVSFLGIGGTSNTKTINIIGQRLHENTGQAIKTLGQLYPTTTGLTDPGAINNFDPVVVTSVELPGGYKWQYNYNVYGEVIQVITPSLGKIEYDYTPNADGGLLATGEVFRRVLERRVFPSMSGSLEGKTEYGDPTVKTGTNTVVLENHKDSSGNRLAATRHTFMGNSLDSYGANPDGPLKDTGYRPWLEGKEIKTEELNFGGGPIKTTTYDYELREAVGWVRDNNAPVAASFAQQPENNTRLVQLQMTHNESNQVAIVNYDYDQYNNSILEQIKDFNGQTLKKVVRAYVTNLNGIKYDKLNTNLANTDTHMRSLVASEEVQDGNNNVESRTTFEYDNYSGANHAALVSRSLTGAGTTTHDSANYSASRTYRGNVTEITAASGVVGTVASITNPQYDMLGNMVATIGPLNNQQQTNVTYDAASYFTYPLQTSKPVANANGSNRTLTSSTVYDFFTGAVLSSTGFNGDTVTYSYNDQLDRVTKETRPNTFGVSNYDYSTAGAYPNTVHVQSSLEGTTTLDSFTEYDGLLRSTLQRRTDPIGEVSTTTSYDGLGRVSQVTNPQRSGSDETSGYTKSTYDAISRVTKVETFGSDNVSTGAITSLYSGSTVTVTDQAGKQRKSFTDALGRLKVVTEPDENGILSLNTNYTYDARGNLGTVNQGAQTRSFSYDGLSRLVATTNPESGTTTYAYDTASNLRQKQDARNIITTYSYDTLNRVAHKGYSDLTPDVDYFYDNVVGNLGAGFSPGFGLGRLTGITTANTPNQTATGTLYRYDIGGRLTNGRQFLDGVSYNSSTSYNLASLPISQTYPSGKVINHSYNIAGQISQVRYDNQTLADAITYTAPGSVTQQLLGNNLSHSMNYNSRLQPVSIKLGTTSGGAEKFQLSYDYGQQTKQTLQNTITAGAVLQQEHNNGNIGRITLTHGAGAKPIEQNFAYDELNRLQLAKELATNPTHPPNLFVNSHSNLCNDNTFTVTVSDVDDPINGVIGLSYEAFDTSDFPFIPISVNGLTSAIGTATFDVSAASSRCIRLVVTATNAQGMSSSTSTGNFDIRINNNSSNPKDDINPLNISTSWQQAYVYDRYGNRTELTDLQGTHPTNINAASNRLSDASYDEAGNITTDIYGNSYSYDAENRLTAATVNGVTSNYYYDGSGKRVKKDAPAINGLTRFVYDGSGKLVAEYEGEPTPATNQPDKEYIYGPSGLLAIADASNNLTYLTPDHLGSNRVVTDASGNVQSRMDYYPFGGAIDSATGNRTSLSNYGFSTTLRQKFTGYERDDETGLDFAQARYYNNMGGRFISPDKPFVDQHTSNPQSWNLYTYVRNNPLKYIDDIGEELKYASDKLKAISEALRAESSDYNEALKAHEGNGAPDLLITFGDAGKDISGIKAIGLTSPDLSDEKYNCPTENCTTIPAMYYGATITIDDSIKSDNEQVEKTLAHEVGHDNDARTDPKQYIDRGEKTKSPQGIKDHDKRPEEEVANKFRDKVLKQKEEFKKQNKDKFKEIDKQKQEQLKKAKN